MTRYILATRLTPPTNQSILQCFGRTLLGLFGCIGLLITYHLVSESDALTTFCGIVHDSDEKVAPKLTLPSVVPGLLILCCACVAFTADLHLKWFVDEHIQNHGNHHPGTIYNSSLCDISQLFLDLRLQLSYNFTGLTNTIPVRATQISLAGILFGFVGIGAFFGLGVFGFEFVVLMTAVAIAGHVPLITFLTFKAHNNPAPVDNPIDSNEFNEFMDMVEQMQQRPSKSDSIAMTEASKNLFPAVPDDENDEVFEDPEPEGEPVQSKKTELVTVLKMINEGLDNDHKLRRQKIKSSSLPV